VTDIARRSLLTPLPLLAAVPAVASEADEFPVVRDEACLNNAHWHPMSRGAMQAAQKYLDFKAHGFGAYAAYGMELQQKVRTSFAQLIGAKAEEISFVPSTMVGENLVVNGLLDFSGGGANVVTDSLHFEGSHYMYGELARTRGLEVRTVAAKNNRIDLDDLDRAIDRKTRLVAVSLVSMFNGFQHDLKAVCERAHAKGAYVYADIIQGAGAVPFDVKQTGVDFCACATYKWLMGDMGAGFLYVREELLANRGVIRKSQYGYRQPTATGAASLFEVGTIANAAIACLSHSIPYIRSLGVDRIQAHRQPLLERIQKEMPRLGFRPLTPLESRSPIVAFARENARRDLPARLNAAKVNIEIYDHRVRISPSIYNDLKDVDRLLQALG
jgi:selenocysteine lyase/cysteine desulfurase